MWCSGSHVKCEQIRTCGATTLREIPREEHLQELRSYLSVRPFGLADYRFLVHQMTDLATQTDKPIVLAANALQQLRNRSVILQYL
jgi:hypothetical protein